MQASKNSDKVSVVIPVYNGEKYIKKAIKSVLEQTYPYIEIIVIDDASTDNTKDIVLKEFKNHIIYHRNPQNMERSISRNKGVELSTGKYIFFLDYDDEWERDYIEQSLFFLENHDVVYSFPRTFINENGSIIRKSKKIIPNDLGELIFSGMIGYPSATAFKREKFLGYRNDILMREDWEIFIRAYLHGFKIKIIDNDKVKIREHVNRTSKNYSFFYATKKVFWEYKDIIPKKYYPYFAFHYAETAMRFGEAMEGWQVLIPVLLRYPHILKDSRRIFSLLKRGWRFKIF